MKIKIFFLLEIVRNDVKKAQNAIISLSFLSYVNWQPPENRQCIGREGGERWQNEGLEALKRLFMNEYGSVWFCHTLVTYFQ